MIIDPVFRLIIELGLGVLFLSACVHKLRAPAIFISTLADYQIFPAPLLAPLGWLIVAAEAFAGAALLTRLLAEPGLVCALLLLLGYSAGISLNLVRGRRYIDCGCTGPAMRQSISEWLVVRNLILAGAGALCLQAVIARQLGLIDASTVLFGVLTSALIYSSANFLIASGPKLQQLRNL
jgi:hypothetical protein